GETNLSPAPRRHLAHQFLSRRMGTLARRRPLRQDSAPRNHDSRWRPSREQLGLESPGPDQHACPGAMGSAPFCENSVGRKWPSQTMTIQYLGSWSVISLDSKSQIADYVRFWDQLTD